MSLRLAFTPASIRRKLNRPVDILPLALFRIAFGAVMFASTLRFMLKGWIDALYIQPQFHFSYLGFEWVKPLDAAGMSAVFIALLILSLFIMLGLAYRPAIALFFALQLTLPLRHYLYPGDANWTMEGYRFAWRVMPNEKAGFATFYLVDKTAVKTRIVYGSQYLTPQQLRHMAYQPDMILQFARFLAARYPQAGQHELAVYAEVHVAHNGKPSKLLIDPGQNLLEAPRDIFSAPWILRY